jgi:hypothetical protein
MSIGDLIATANIDVPSTVERAGLQCHRPGCTNPRATRSRYCCRSCRLCAGTARQRARKRATSPTTARRPSA